LADTNQQAIVKNLNHTLKSISNVANDFTQGSKNYDELTNTLLLMQESLQELKPLLREVNNKPNSLIFNGVVSDDVEPKKAIFPNVKSHNNE